MKRTSRSVGVISLAVGAIVLVFALGRQQESEEREPGAASVEQSNPTPSADRISQDTDGPARDNPEGETSTVQPTEAEGHDSQSELEADLKWLREETTKEVLEAYALMFKNLGLTEAEHRGLTDFLVEVWVSGTWMRNYSPDPIDEGDRQAGIAAIIGDAKLEQLLHMERNRAEYREAGRVGTLLQTNDVPLTAAQQDHLLGILIQVRGSEQAVADPNAQRGTVESIESQLATMDEYERLVLELAPSVLSDRQMELLFERYQALSYRRAQILEMQKKSRANDTDEDDFPLGYPPRD